MTDSETPRKQYRREDTCGDIAFFDITIDTPLVIAAQPSETISPIKEEDNSFSENSAIFPGPQKWEEGYQSELKTEAERILRSFAKNPVDSDFDSSTMAPVVEHNLADRLGRGYLDPTELTLVTEENAMPHAVASRRSLSAAQFARISGRIGFHGRMGSRIREERRRQELRDKILPSCPNFSPEFYLSHIHSETSLDDLREGMRYLEVELSKRTDQLKTLVKEHFEGFISCKNSIDDVHLRLRRNETQKNGASTSSLKASIADAQTEIIKSFSPILERHDKVEQLKHVMEILKRNQSSFNLPSNIRQLSQNNDFRQVVTEYRRAKSIMSGADLPIWQSLFEEVKKETTDVCIKISKMLEDALLSLEEVQELVTCICQLRNEGLEYTATLAPVMLWLVSVEDYINNMISRLTSKHRKQLEMSSPSRQKHKPSRSPFEGDSKNRAFPGEIAEHCTDYITRLCRLISDHLPKIWKLKRSSALQKMGEVSSEIQDEILNELNHVDVITKGIFDCFSKRIVETMEHSLVSEGLLPPCVFTILRELRLFAADMKECPMSCSAELNDLVQECFEMCVRYLCTHLRQQMASLAEWEDWKIRIGSYCRGHPVTSVPYKLGKSVRGVMEQFKQIKSEITKWVEGSARFEYRSLNNAFNECFESFVMAVEGLAAEILEPSEPASRHSSQTVEISKLLILISNSMYIRQRIIPELTRQYAEIISVESKKAPSIEAQFESLENMMIQKYVEHAKKLVEKSVDATIATEKESPPLKLMDFKATDAPTEWIAVISDINAEIQKYAPAKCSVVLNSMVVHLVKRMKGRIQDLGNLGFLLQMYIDAMFVETVFKGIDIRDLHKAWRAVYERLGNLIRDKVKSMSEMDKEKEMDWEDSGINVLNTFSESDLEDVMKLDKKLQRMFKEGVKGSIKSMGLNLASLRVFKST